MENKTDNLQYSFIVCVNNYNLFVTFTDSLNKIHINNYEIVKVDNDNNKYNLPGALNKGRALAQGDILFFCHQDIIFQDRWLDKAVQQIQLVSERDNEWGVLGVIGIKKNGFFAGNIIDPHTQFKMGHLPCQVSSLDEVCLVMRKSTSLYFDENLGGFHLYGADICLQAQQKGMKCYAIDAPLTHLSGGKLDHSFWEMAEKLKNKWSQIQNSPNTIETTCGVFRLKNTFWSVLEFNFKILRRKIIGRIQKRHRISSE